VGPESPRILGTLNWSSSLKTVIPSLRRYALLLTSDPQSADDLVQDCLERILKSKDKYDPTRSLRSWAFGIMHNLHVDNWRKNKTKPTLVSIDGELVDQFKSSGENFQPELADTIAAFGQLSVEHREVLVLVAIEGMSYREASECIGIPPGTIMSRLARARGALKHILEPTSTADTNLRTRT